MSEIDLGGGCDAELINRGVLIIDGEFGTALLPPDQMDALCKRSGRNVPFRLSDGESHHPDPSNARANGLGFDVWPSKEAYEESQRIESERKRHAANWWRLSARMLDDRPFRSGLRDFPPEVVQALHATLDAARQP